MIKPNLKNVHSEVDCEGRPCCIHHPSNHPLKDADQIWSDFGKKMIRVCQHGIFHPDVDDIQFRAKSMDDQQLLGYTLHTCDGCCGFEKAGEAPGKLATTDLSGKPPPQGLLLRGYRYGEDVPGLPSSGESGTDSHS